MFKVINQRGQTLGLFDNESKAKRFARQWGGTVQRLESLVNETAHVLWNGFADSLGRIGY